MKVTFEGSVEEYRAIFRGGEPSEFQPSGLAALGTMHDSSDLPVNSLPFGASGHIHLVEEETNRQVLAARGTPLPELKPELRTAAWEFWVHACVTWVDGFEVAGAVQPDRLVLVQEMGSGRWPIPILVMIHEIGSLQALVEKALREAGLQPAGDDRSQWLDYVGRVAANMVQVGHMGFSELANLMDYSEKWRR